ncbi:MAG: hypothetical protein K6E74_04895 [Bacilli bacterium]|nr:hypothetical protein [Bacilli bacterium]
MTLKLAKNEIIIKRFDYTTRKIKNSKRSLIVTNKRIISEIMDRNSVMRKEIPVSEAEYISTSYANTKSSLVAFILFLIMAIVAGIVGWKVSLPVQYLNYGLYGLAGLFLLLSCIMLGKFFKNRAASVEITISGKKMETQVFSLGSSNMSSKSKAKDLKIQIDRNQSIAMVNELGAVLIDVKNQSLDELHGGTKEEKAPEEVKEDVPVEEPAAPFVEEQPEEEPIEEEITSEELLEEQSVEEISSSEEEAFEEPQIEEEPQEEPIVEEPSEELETEPEVEETPVEEEMPLEETHEEPMNEEVAEEQALEEETQPEEAVAEQHSEEEPKHRFFRKRR